MHQLLTSATEMALSDELLCQYRAKETAENVEYI